MGLRLYKPTTNARRNASVNLHTEVTKDRPEKSLLRPLPKTGGRNNQGKITVRGRGQGHKRRYRLIDFRRTNDDMPATVIGIEYDPNRTCHIALLQYADGTKRYILAPHGLTVGEAVVSSAEAIEPTPGNCMPLRHIPTGLTLHNIEFEPGKGGGLCRSAGAGARLTNREGRWATLVLPSGEIRQVSVKCRATIGQLDNADHQNIKLGKAGRTRHRGRRPHVRGVAMNPRDHPHGGGEGRSGIGMPGPKSPWGKPTLGYKTRRKKKSSAMIVKRRK